MQVLDQQRVTVGTRTITYNRIAPPVFPAATPVAKPTPQNTPTTKAVSRAPQRRTKEAGQSNQNGDAGDGEKPFKALMLSTTVYDHQFTEVSWPDGIEPALRAYVNIDFRYFTTVTNFDTADASYDLFFAWSNDTAASLTQAGRQLPNFSFSAGRSGYQIIAGDPNLHPEALIALDALCAYYDANSARMIAAYDQREADPAARQQWLLDHPPVQLDTVINYWPAKSQMYLPAGK